MMHAMEAAGKRLAFWFDVQAWLDFEEAYYSTDELLDRIREGKRPMEARIQLAAVTATAGARKEGREDNVTPQWLKEHLTPKQIREATTMAQAAWLEGMQRDAEDEDEDIDVVAKELAEKKDKADA